MSNKKHPTKKEEKRVQSFLKQMEWMFGLQNYDRTICFSKNADDTFAANVVVEEDYQRVKITIYPCFWDNTLKNQREYLLHEFCHYLTDSLANLAWDMMQGKLQTKEHRRLAVEKSTSMVSNIIDSLLCDNMSFAKVAYKKYLSP